MRDPAEISEDHPVLTGRLTPLHVSKRAAEIYTQMYTDTYGLKAATFRLTGMYGCTQFGGEDHGWVANFAIRTILRLPIKIFGTGKQARDIVYVTDVAEAFDRFYQRQKPGIYNIGGGKENLISLIECLALIRNLTGIPQSVHFEAERFGDLRYFACDITKAKRDLRWEPTTSNETGVKKLVSWVQQEKAIFE